jgi:hypothetical protein
MSSIQLKAIKVCSFTARSSLVLAADSDGKRSMHLLENETLKPFTHLSEVDIYDME